MASKYASATGSWSTMTWLNGHTGATQMHPQRRLSVKAKSIPKSIIWCAFNIYSLYAFWKINRGLRGFAWIKNCKMNFKKYIICFTFAVILFCVVNSSFAITGDVNNDGKGKI